MRIQEKTSMPQQKMTFDQFFSCWKNNTLNERSGAQGHFDDLCDLLGVEKPRDDDNYCFERGAKKAGGGNGWADVWKRDCFGWENKKPGRNLDDAHRQLAVYAGNLENPPLQVVCDRERIIIHTAFPGYPDEPREIRIEELADPSVREILRWVFNAPEKLKPEKSNAAITALAASHFANIATTMRLRGLDSQRVAHFLVQCLFCMFAEDEGLLPEMVFTQLLDNASDSPSKAVKRIGNLFAAMRDKGGEYGDHDIPWFNGGLFKTIDIPDLTGSELAALMGASLMDWRAIDPTILGTLFERSLDPATRAPLGAHYTDPATIAKLIEPLITKPLLAKWEAAKQEIASIQGKKPKNKKGHKEALAIWQGFLSRLYRFRVLDPACGSGNFLYLSLAALRNIERLVLLEGRVLFGFLQTELWLNTGPHNICGIEINEYAAELARVTVWIGDIQWCRRNGWEIVRDPILRQLDTIEHRDALLNDDGSEAKWPEADVIVGNPPFLGDKMMRGELGDEYVDKLRKRYEGRVPGGADLVTYWFEKTRAQIEGGKASAAGLVATNSIRGGANRKVLERVVASTKIFEAWSDEPWINYGAAVRVSLICFGEGNGVVLDGQMAVEIHADLTAGVGLNVSRARRLMENVGASFQGPVLVGHFDVKPDLARSWLILPNPNGLPNSDVLRPLTNGKDITSRTRGLCVVDFNAMDESVASLYEQPFEYVRTNVKPTRDSNRDESRRKRWWLHGRLGTDWRTAKANSPRYIATSRVSKHRLFVWFSAICWPSDAVVAIARADDTTFGILHSRFHELWSLRMCTWMGKGNDPRYTPTTCFETFPFPPGLSPADTAPKSDEERQALGYIPFVGEIGDQDGITPIAPYSEPTPALIANTSQRCHAQAIAKAAFTLNQLREAWLNPPDWVKWTRTPAEEKAGFPLRPVAKPLHEDSLKKRTLTNLYNLRPTWLDIAHNNLDKAVALAYGWNDYAPEMADNTVLSLLLAMNHNSHIIGEVYTVPQVQPTMVATKIKKYHRGNQA